MKMVLAVLLVLAMTAPVMTGTAMASIDAETHELARRTQARAIEYLRSTQDASGGWSVSDGEPGGAPDLPAITALALNGILLDPRTEHSDEMVVDAVRFILSFQREGGGIHDDLLPTYNTAISLSALSHIHDPEAARAIRNAVPALRRAQWGAFDISEVPNPDAPQWNEPVDEEHPFYGGVGYGNNGRPDMSNTQFFLQALDDAGVSSEDPAVQRALVFLRRTQMDDRVNEMAYAEGSRQGGFIYATVPNAESVDSIPGQSQAGNMTETLVDGTRGVRLRAYGSMTYAGFKSLIYADLSPGDTRVEAARSWIESNWTLDENPGMGDDGFYYYLVTLSRALDALGEPVLDLSDGDEVNWKAEAVRAIADLQQEDGSFRSRSDRWMEDNPALITAYALIALGHASR